MADEIFYAVTLNAQSNTVTWDAGSSDEEFQRNKLVIKQILLGWEAKEDEFNVVEVQVAKDQVKIPIAVLKAGETRAVNPDIEFYENSPVTFKLIKGNGPVYIHGQHLKDMVEEVVDMDDEESDEEDDADEEEDEAHAKKKARLENNADGKNSKPKKK